MKPIAVLFDRNFPRPIAWMIEQYEAATGSWPGTRTTTSGSRSTPRTWTLSAPSRPTRTGAGRWALVSQDKRIARRPAERAVLDAAGIKFFYFGKAWSRMTTHQQAWKFIREWPKLVEVAENHRAKVFEIEGANLKITPAG